MKTKRKPKRNRFLCDGLHTRTVVLLIQTDLVGDDPLKPHIVNALRQYANAVEQGNCGNEGQEKFVPSPTPETRLADSCFVRVIHGSDFTV